MALNAIHALLSDLQGESNPPVGIACQTQRSAVELHDLPRKAQPDARAVGLGRVEGGKDIFGDLGRDRSPVVLNSMITVYAEAERKRADEQSSTGRKHLAKILSLDAKP